MSVFLQGLCRAFGSVLALDKIDLQANPGEVVGLIGPNGSGKTTLLRILATAVAPSAGQVLVAGHNAASAPDQVRRHVGYLPEAPPVEPFARVEEYLLYRAQLKGLARRRRQIEVERCLKACDLWEVRRRFLERLALGYRRRAGLADALLGGPSVLLLDEPTLGLDPLQVRAFRELLARETPRCTTILSTHLLAEAESVCTRAVVLDRGRLLSDVPLGPAGRRAAIIVDARAPANLLREALLADYAAGQLTVLSRDDPWTKCRLEQPGATPERVAEVCLQRGWLVRELGHEANTLEEHFVRVARAARREAA